MATPAQQQQTSAETAAAAAGTAVVLAPPAVAAVAPVAAGAALAGAGAVAAAAIMAALVRFLAALRERHRKWLTATLGGKGHRDDVAQVVAREAQLEAEFARNSANRVASKLPTALKIADREQRAAAVRRILADEERFAQQRQNEMLRRAMAGLERASVRRISPLGAYWRLGVAQDHTEGCLFMQGKFWPWAVLDRVHPPRHYGCTSSLHSFGEAIHNGWMTPEDVPDTRAAIRAASGVMMEAEDAVALLREVDVREALLESGVPAERFNSIEWEGMDGASDAVSPSE